MSHYSLVLRSNIEPRDQLSGYKLMQMVPNFIARRPLVPELDYSGIVVDSNGTELKDGQAVFGMIPGPPIGAF